METWKKWIIGLASLFSWTFLFSPSPILSRQVIPFGLCPKYNPRIMYQLYQPFIDYLNEATPYRFEIKLSRVYQDTIDRLGSGEIIIASCGPVSYIKASEKYPVKPILRALNKDGKPYYRGIIIVREGSEIHNLSDLKGRSFAFGQAWSTASHILPEYYLSKANIKLKDLKHYDFLRHHDSVANAVLKGQFDAGAVKDIVAYKYRKDGLRFIFMTDPIPTVPIVVRVNAPQEMVKSVKTALLNLNLKDPNCQKKMTRWDEEFKYGFTEALDSDYDSIRKILRVVEKEHGNRGQIRE
ncbi:MAG: phosphonate ABC transporter substrate-binding protein [Deltaproteobacteria bacterium CG03_land_8_20_14_0_80_45_14]|jgi:phosphonate transport system substrate-binding protein|nr:MAG: phosphonate ABC transporter substrate-binding protein [Deltaproteobacteria bacterium CG03_land_8_20_14_0_80_45_14]